MSMIAMWIAAIVAGIAGSMGLGGGSVLLLYLLLTDISQRAAQGLNLLFILPVGLVGLYFHLKNGYVEKNIIVPLLLGGIIGIILGTLLAGLMPDKVLRILFNVLLLILGIRELRFGIKLLRKK